MKGTGVRTFAALGLGGAAILISALASAQAPARAQGSPPAPRSILKRLDRCPDGLDGYLDSDATAGLVRRCLGEPASISREPDGRFTYLYPPREGRTAVSFLFDAAGRLIRPTARTGAS